MNKFFSLSSSLADYELSFLEKYIPIFLLIFILFLIWYFKDLIRRNDSLDIFIRYSIGLLSLIFLILYYVLEWSQNGFTENNLPLHLCFISNIFAIILCFNKSKSIFNFILFCGVLGGICSLILPDLSLSSKYFRYYQFMICHTSIIIIPFYFLAIYNYFPNVKNTFNTFIILQLIGIPLGIFNEIFKTNYMFVSFTSNIAAKDSVLYNLGHGYDYFFKLEALVFLSIFLFYFLLYLIFIILPKLTYRAKNKYTNCNID